MPPQNLHCLMKKSYQTSTNIEACQVLNNWAILIKIVITPYHKKQFIIMQIINVSLNLKFKNNICSSSKFFGLYGAPAPLLFSNLITGKERILFLLNEGGGGVTSSSLYAVLVKIFIKIKFSFLCQYICLVLHCIEKKLYRNYS